MPSRGRLRTLWPVYLRVYRRLLSRSWMLLTPVMVFDGLLVSIWGYRAALAGLAVAVPVNLLILILIGTFQATRHVNAVAGLSYGLSPETLGVEHARVVELPLSMAQAFQFCLEAVKSLPVISFKVDAERQRIQATTLDAPRGSQIALELVPSSEWQSQVTIKTRPFMRGEAVDYGRALDAAEGTAGYRLSMSNRKSD